MIDVGACHGDVSLRFAKKGWRVIAFEPENRNRAIFNKKLQGFMHVSCFDKAVSDVTGDMVPFYVSDEHFGINSLKPFHKTHRQAYNVETIRLDDVLEEMKVHGVTFLKVDIEGADFLALKGFDFEKYRPELVMAEFMDDRSSSNFGYTHHDMAQFMEERGYAVFVSEWAEFDEYGGTDVSINPHKWLQCKEYPIDHEAVWGNLIFVPKGNEGKFKDALDSYVLKMKIRSPFLWCYDQIKRIPGLRKLKRALWKG
ncbi:MAG: FkbM family methyltransferase [Dissulfuribacterales bacterium]